jgi:hypothetical protein
MVEFRSTGRAGLVSGHRGVFVVPVDPGARGLPEQGSCPSGPTEGAPVVALVDGGPRRVTRTASGAFFARDR